MSPEIKRAEKKFTYGDYCTWPDDERWELIDGVAFDMTPAPSRQHSLVQGALQDILRPFFRGKPCEVHNAPFDVRLPKGQEADELVDTVVQPDLLVVCDEKKLDDKGCRGAPDLVIEILSPSTSSRDHVTKKYLYEKHGVKEFWIVSPTDRRIIVYALESSDRFRDAVIYSDIDIIKCQLFPGLEVDLGYVFSSIPRIVRESPKKYLV